MRVGQYLFELRLQLGDRLCGGLGLLFLLGLRQANGWAVGK